MNKNKSFTSRRLLLSLAPFLTLALLDGCHSPFVEATVANHSGSTINVIEVDYPSASFGTQSLANGSIFHYRFKVLGDGPLKLQWTDAANHDHNAQGPEISEGQEGKLAIDIGPAAAAWHLEVHAQPK